MIANDVNTATILPISENVKRPLWSVMIPTYNCANYLRETLASVLAQDPGPEVMQIEVVDDHSTKDDPKAVVEELGKGRVGFYQQPQNVGYIKNFETCLQRSRGKTIHLLHGDDWVEHGFYERIQQLFEQHQEIGAAFCRQIYVDEKGRQKCLSQLEQLESGVLENWLEKIVSGIPIQTASMVVKRHVYEELGGFDQRFTCCFEDREMWVRIATHYPIGYEIEPLAAYRLMSNESLSKRKMRSGEYSRDLNKGHKIIESRLRESSSVELTKHVFSKARETSAFFMLSLANQMLQANDVEGVLNQLREAFICSQSFKVIKAISKILIKLGLFQLRSIATTISV